MIVAFANVSNKAKGVWKASIDPLNLRKLNRSVHQCGRINVVMVSKPQFDNRTHSLQFDRDTAVFLNRGDTDETVFIRSVDNNCGQAFINTKSEPPKNIYGDQLFLTKILKLGESKQKVGKAVLRQVRKKYNGQLIHHPGSGNFVESPDRFWSIQVKTQSYQIIVYGKPNDHGPKQDVKLDPYMESYSAFVIAANYQIVETVQTIIDGMRLKKIHFK